MADTDTITALARHLASLGIPRSQVAAAESVNTLRARGWKPPPPTEEWQRTSGPPADPDAARVHADECRAALADALEQERLRPVPRRRASGGEP